MVVVVGGGGSTSSVITFTVVTLMMLSHFPVCFYWIFTWGGWFLLLLLFSVGLGLLACSVGIAAAAACLPRQAASPFVTHLKYTGRAV